MSYNVLSKVSATIIRFHHSVAKSRCASYTLITLAHIIFSKSILFSG